MNARTYWIFTLTFWLIVTGILLVNTFPNDHLDEVVYRFFFLPILGILICSAHTLIYQADGFRKLKFPQPWVVLLCLLSALLMALTLNLITFLLLGLEVENRHHILMHNGAPTFTLIFLFWAFIWFDLDGRPLLGPKPTLINGHLQKVQVEHLGKSVTLKIADVEYISAAGDYVEFQMPEQAYLKKGTISSLESMLDPGRFLRVHRSTIINSDHISGSEFLGNGSFRISFRSGHSVTSSRSYKSVLQNILTE